MTRRAWLCSLSLMVAACTGRATPTPSDTDAMLGIDAKPGGGPGDSAAVVDLGNADTPAPTSGCPAATGSGTAKLDQWLDGTDVAKVAVSGSDCARSYLLSTTAQLRDGLPANPRTVVEQPGSPRVRTLNPLFDALYALALEEAKQDSVDAIQDAAFNQGQPIACPPGGCFETGRLWRYVWTRDVAYASHLALALMDPQRARNSLEFKLSARRSGGDTQVRNVCPS